jgi:hypothetical protein
LATYTLQAVRQIKRDRGQDERLLIDDDGARPHSACGSSTLGMLVEMLVEGVFLVSGVVKTVFSRFKKKVREFFCFSPRTKESNAGLRGTFQIASFPYGNAENMFYNFVVLFFSPVRNGGRNSKHVERTSSVFFFSVNIRREKFYACPIELVPHFFFP